MEAQNKIEYQRKKTASVVVLLALMLFLTGTFAWYSISQRALNELNITANSGGRIHDDFYSQDVQAMRSNHANKDIYAENFGENDLIVRIKLSEYLEIDGQAVTGESKDDRSTWVPYVLENEEEAREYVNWKMGGFKVYLPTFNLDQNNLSTDAKGDAIDELTGAATGFGDGTHNYFSPAGSHFEVDGTKVENITATSHTSKSTLMQDNEVMSMEAWLALDEDEKVGNFWVVDADGWAYWANLLRPNTATSLLLNEFHLESGSMAESMYYAIDVIGEFATINDVDSFYNGESDHGDASSKGQDLINTILDGKPVEQSFIPRQPGETFTDSNGILWRVLDADDGNGNALIITEYVYNLPVSYNTTNAWVPFEESNLKNDPLEGMDAWYDSQVGNEIKSIALNYEYPDGAYLGGGERSGPEESGYNSRLNLEIARTVAGNETTVGNGQVFALSISELNEYVDTGALNAGAFHANEDRIVRWWLRSPGMNSRDQAVTTLSGGQDGQTFGAFPSVANATGEGFRAALWVRR